MDVISMRTIAFIPVRGGSKSIPLKNIKHLCGRPLVYWSVLALQNVDKVDEIVVATDSDEIEGVVRSFSFSKVKIYRRLPENASDVASTESVMLEYIQKSNLTGEDVFMLVQATSPLTESIHFEEALSFFSTGEFDSVLSCVRSFRFFWNADGTSGNYDYRHRPRRQNFAGNLMENGAFYINTVKNILNCKNRLSGKIGIYEMPAYTAVEIDEPGDWMIIESLLHDRLLLNRQSIHQKNIKLFLTDVDGVLTDGGMYYSENGDELKKFNTRDGMAFRLIRNAGIKTGMITSENTRIVENRAKKLGVDYLYQDQKEKGKLDVALEICAMEGITLDEVAYIGDDVNCLELLTYAGLSACPADAVDEIKRIADIIILTRKGGEGVVREFAEKILKNQLLNK